VVATLWRVRDDASLLFMLRFYELWQQQPGNPAEALRAAQMWLRDSSNGQIRKHLETPLETGGSWPPRPAVEACYEMVALKDDAGADFGAPDCWAAYVCQRSRRTARCRVPNPDDAGRPTGPTSPHRRRSMGFGKVVSAGTSIATASAVKIRSQRSWLADPDLLVLDEATSAVDPATEVRLQRALDAVTRGRTTVAIAHRLSTAQAADEVIVVDRGRVVQRGSHEELVREPDSVYGKLYASWLEQTR
jgi:hypothetical protein